MDHQFSPTAKAPPDAGLSSPQVVSDKEKEGVTVEKVSDSVDAGSNCYREYYFCNPCVLIDFPSVQEASKQCPRTPFSFDEST